MSYRTTLTKDIDSIKPPTNPLRKDLGDLDALAESIKTNGLIHPIMVVRNFPDYEIVHGHRRWMAAKKAGLTKIDVEIVQTHSERDIFEIALAENHQRKSMTNEELAEAAKRYLEKEEWGGQARLAKVLGVSRACITELLSGLTIKEQNPEARDLPTSTAYEASKVELKKQSEVVKAAIEEDLTRQEVRDVVKKVKDGKEVSTALREVKARESPKQSEYRVSAYTLAEQAFAEELSRRGVRYESQYPIGDFTKRRCPEGHITFLSTTYEDTRNTDIVACESCGKPASFMGYQVDFLIKDTLIVEIEGEGSASKNNKERDEYLKRNNYAIEHISNDQVLRDPKLCVQILAENYKTFFPKEKEVELPSPLERVIEQLHDGIRSAEFTWKDILAVMDAELTGNLAASFRLQLSEKSKCPVCGHEIIEEPGHRILDAVSRLGMAKKLGSD